MSTGVGYSLSPEGLLVPGTVATAKFDYYEDTTTCRDDGGSYDAPPTCTYDHSTSPVEIISATCGSPGCTVEVLSSDQLSITSDLPGSVFVRAVMQRVGTPGNLTKELTIDYSEASRFDVVHDRSKSLGGTLPVIKGTRLNWCAVAYGTVGAKEIPLYVTPAIATQPQRLRVDGTVLTADSTASDDLDMTDSDGFLGCLGFRASEVGTGWFAIEFAGQRRVLALQVVDPMAVVGGTLHDVQSTATNPLSYVASVDTPAWQPCQHSSLNSGGQCDSWAIYGVQFKLSDGTVAAGYWAYAGDNLTAFMLDPAATEPSYGLSGGYDREGLFSVNGFRDWVGDLRLAPGTDDPSVTPQSFVVPLKITRDSDECTACGS